MLLLRNTVWTRELYSEIRSMLDSPATIAKVSMLPSHGNQHSTCCMSVLFRPAPLVRCTHQGRLDPPESGCGAICILVGHSRSKVSSAPTPVALPQMLAGLAHYHEEYGGRNDRTALVWLVHNDPDKYLPQVRFKSSPALLVTYSFSLVHHTTLVLVHHDPNKHMPQV